MGNAMEWLDIIDTNDWRNRADDREEKRDGSLNKANVADERKKDRKRACEKGNWPQRRK
jgi:hypothetical protein